MSRVRIGLFLSAQFPPDASARVGLDAVVQQAELAEELGFDAVFLGHHYLARSAFLQPLPLAAYLARATTRVRIGLGVLVAPLFNPLALAEELATLDVLSDGRITVGLGAGYRRSECTAFGVDWDDRVPRLRAMVPILRALWRGESVTASGSWGALDDARLPLECVQEGGPPIWLGAFAPGAIRRAAELDAPWLIGPEGTDSDVASRLAGYRDALVTYGHSLDRVYPLMREASVAGTTREAAERIRPHLEAQYAGYRSWDAAQRIDIDEFIHTHCLVGSPDTIVARVCGLADDLGITDVVLRTQFMGMPHADALDTIRLVGEHVIPRLDSRRTTSDPVGRK